MVKIGRWISRFRTLARKPDSTKALEKVAEEKLEGEALDLFAHFREVSASSARRSYKAIISSTSARVWGSLTVSRYSRALLARSRQYSASPNAATAPPR